MFILCSEQTYTDYYQMLFKNLKNPKTKHMKYKKQKPQKTNLSDFYVKYCTGIFKFCPNYEQQKNERQCFQIKIIYTCI